MSWANYIQWAQNLGRLANGLEKNVRFGWDNSNSWFPTVKFGPSRQINMGNGGSIPIVGPPSSSRYQGPGSVQRPAYRSKYGGVKTWTKTKKGSKKGSWKAKLQKRRADYINNKLRQVAPLAKDLILDQLADRVTSPQGLCAWLDSGGLSSKNTVISTFAFTPCNAGYMQGAIPGIDPINAFTQGKSKFIRHDWNLTTRMTNLSNCPAEVQAFTIKCRKDVPVNSDSDTGLQQAQTFKDFINRMFFAQYGPNTVTNPQYGPTHAGFKLTDLTKFNEFFKIMKSTRNVIQPGEAIRIEKLGKKSRTFDSSRMYNAASAELTQHFMKGDCFYVYRVNGVPQSQTGVASTAVTLCDVILDVVHTVRLRMSILPYSTYDSVAAPGQLATGQTIKLIFPGTSAAGTAAPAT